MKTHHIKKLPVILNNEIVGIVTATDLSHNMPEFSRELKKMLTEEKPFRFVEPVPYKKDKPQSY